MKTVTCQSTTRGKDKLRNYMDLPKEPAMSHYCLWVLILTNCSKFWTWEQ